DEDDGGLLTAGMLADHGSQLEAVDLGHADIHQHDGNVGPQKMLQGFSARRGLDQVLPEIAEDGLIGEQLARLIIDHEDIDTVSGTQTRTPHLAQASDGAEPAAMTTGVRN